MPESQIIQGREIGGAELAEVRALIEANPSLSRRRLSERLARQWEWYTASGVLKDMAARTLLLKLDERKLITLPPRRRMPSTRRKNLEPDLFEGLPAEPVVASLSSWIPLQIQVVAPKQPDYRQFQKYLCQHHYLGFRGPVGENIGYFVKSAAGVDLACVLFGAAAWQCAPRDRWIGWSAEQRAQRLALVANNSRFLVLPHVRVPGLANHILARIARRIDTDWQERYRHRIHLLETFVQPDRFRGTCYQAANWIRVGQTTGRTRQNQRHRDNEVHAPVKDVYLYALSSDARQQLCG
jgi:hypothetical protein